MILITRSFKKELNKIAADIHGNRKLGDNIWNRLIKSSIRHREIFRNISAWKVPTLVNFLPSPFVLFRWPLMACLSKSYFYFPPFYRRLINLRWCIFPLFHWSLINMKSMMIRKSLYFPPFIDMINIRWWLESVIEAEMVGVSANLYTLNRKLKICRKWVEGVIFEQKFGG